MRDILYKIKNILVHVLVLVIVFIVSVIGFARLVNETMPTSAQQMENSTFPLVYMVNKGVMYNCLHGYAYEMDVNYIRDTLTVLSDDHELNIQIQPFGSNIESVSYEVLSLDGIQSLENTNVIQLTEENGYLNTTLQLQNNMLLEQEYILKLMVTAGGRKIYYYTRLVLEDGLHLDQYLDFVTGFYAKCVNKTDQTSLGTVVEPNATTGTSKTLAVMDLHDSVSQLMWGSLNPQVYYKPTPSLVDINRTTASFVLNYRISAIGTDGLTDIFNVEEFYRLRYTDTRIFLLDFTRTTEEVFNTDGAVIESAGINLGITDTDVEYAFDSQNKVAAFVQENELWTYRVNGGRLTRVFGFPQKENMDYRDFYDQNNIKVLRVDGSGNVWFAVSGYMNRGVREGENGISIYFYEEASATVREILFIETMEAYDMLKLDSDALSYITENQKECYILLEGIVYRIDLTSGTYERVVDGVSNDCYTSSESNRYFTWLKEHERYDSRTMYTMDLETGTVKEIVSSEGERIRPLCYMGEDLVYGTARESDIINEGGGTDVFPMYELTIINSDGEVLKTYQEKNLYVMSVEKRGSMLWINRSIWQKGAYAAATEDHIVSMDTEDDVAYGVATKETKTKQTEVLLRMGTALNDPNIQVVNSKFLTVEGSKSIRIPTNLEREPLYYVYAGGRMESCWSTAAEAIIHADAKVGVVINDEKEFVWERGNKAESSRIKLDNIPAAVKAGTMNIADLEASTGRVALDLTGCSMEQILYFVSQGKAVLAATPEGTVIITGYDDYGNTILLNPGEEETYYMGPNDSKEAFEKAGNAFVTYLDTEIHK